MAQQKDLEQYSLGDRSNIQIILIVEDDVNIGEVLVQAIAQETPYSAHFVQDGFEALKTVEGIRPSLFILDYHLPRMNGIELYDRLHAMPKLATIPAIMMSARLPQKDLVNRQILGMNKPIDLDEFLQTIEQLLE